jgi:hypothetical protein
VGTAGDVSAPARGEPAGGPSDRLACVWELLATGAYVTSYAAQFFNGFAPLKEHYI